ncbi:PQQ-binding-like beta-propeller repeat protein [Gottfriedia acidiceleris]|uniref:outer membrane protein assembly factor BamB family protein n=1 Tax=Gottfriedia acidiceleris TaxID=371036 RepID=UPI00339A3759
MNAVQPTAYNWRRQSRFIVGHSPVFKWAADMAVENSSGSDTSSPVIGSDGTIYVRSGSYIKAINPDGTIKWTVPFSEYGSSSPVLYSDGSILVGGGYYDSLNGTYHYGLYGLNTDGSKKFFSPTEGSINTEPSIDQNGTIYVEDTFGALYAFNPDGTEKWTYRTNEGNSISSPVIRKDGIIIFGTDRGKLYGVNPEGNYKWMCDLGPSLLSTPVIGDYGDVYVSVDDSTNNGKLYSINFDGSIRLKHTFSERINPSIPLAFAEDGTIFVAGVNTMYAFFENYSLKWSIPLHLASSPIIGNDGTIFITSGVPYPSETNGSGEMRLEEISSNGKEKWWVKLFETSDPLGSTPPLAMGDHGMLYAYDQVAGKMDAYQTPTMNAPKAEDIIVKNNLKGTPDTVTVSNLHDGDMVNIYNARVDGDLLGTSIVPFTFTSATVSIPQLGKAAGTVYVSVSRTGKLESERTEKTYLAQPSVTIAPPVVTQPTQEDDHIVGRDGPGLTISVFASGKLIGSGITDDYGLFLVYIPKQKAGTLLSIIATDDDDNQSKATTMMVIDNDNTKERATPLKFTTSNDEFYQYVANGNGKFENEKDVDYFRITLDAAGMIETDISQLKDAEIVIDLYNDMDELLESLVTDRGNQVIPLLFQGLPAGTYYIRLSIDNGTVSNINYKMNVFYLKSNFVEKEANNTLKTANPITIGKEYIGFSDFDTEDYYKIVTKENGKLTVRGSYSPNVTLYYILINTKGEQVDGWKLDPKDTDETKNLFTVGVRAGTYYLVVSQDDDTYSNEYYETQVNFKADPFTELENNEKTGSATLVLLKRTYNGFISWKNDIDTFKVNVPANANVSFSLSQASSTSFKVEVVNYNNRLIKTFNTKTGKSPMISLGNLNLVKGTYFIKVRYLSGKSDEVSYKLQLQPKIYWGKVEYKPGIVGKVVAVSTSKVYKLKSGKLIYVKSAPKGSEFAVYGSDKYGYKLGNGYYVKKNKTVKYYTVPSQVKSNYAAVNK